MSNFTHKVNLERACRIFLFVSCQILCAKSQSHMSNLVFFLVSNFMQNVNLNLTVGILFVCLLSNFTHKISSVGNFFETFEFSASCQVLRKKLILISHAGLVLVSLVSISISCVGFVFVCLVSNFMEKVNFNLTVRNVFVRLVSNFTHKISSVGNFFETFEFSVSCRKKRFGLENKGHAPSRLNFF